VVIAHPALRRQWRARLGVTRAAVPPGVVWVHAASVGELVAAEALLERLDPPVLLTVDTDAGLARARALAAERRGVFAAVLPVDHPWLWAGLWADARPRALVFVEATWSPALASHARSVGIPVVRVSARAGPRSRRIPVYDAWTAAATEVWARDEASAAWLARHQHAPVTWTGDLKRARAAPANPLRWSVPFVVAGSVQDADRAPVVEALIGWPFGALIAPRRPERAESWRQALSAAGLDVVLRSSLVDGVPTAPVVVLDTLGELAGCWVGARAGFLGGSFDAVRGAHAPVEALVAGVPLVAGPHLGRNDHFAHHLKQCTTGMEIRTFWMDAIGAGAAGVRLAAVTPPALPTAAPAPESSPRPWLQAAIDPWARVVRWRQGRRVRERVDVPVCSVDARNARGPGKTSTAAWWASALAAAGHRPGLLVRGIGRHPDAPPRVRALGDEGALLAERWPVAVGRDAAAAARLIAAGCTVLVIDDGGGASLAVDRRLEVIDARYPGAGGPMPAGDGRPWVGRPPDGVVVHHADAAFPPPVAAVPARVAVPEFGAWRRGDAVESLPTGPVAVFAGLGRAVDALDGLDRPAALWALPDHGRVDRALARRLRAWAGERPLLCTEKDRVRLPPDVADVVWWRPRSIRIDDPPTDWIDLG